MRVRAVTYGGSVGGPVVDGLGDADEPVVGAGDPTDPPPATPRCTPRGRVARATQESVRARLAGPAGHARQIYITRELSRQARCLRFNDDVDRSLRQGPLLRLFTIAQQESRLMQVAMAESPLEPNDFAVYSWLRLVGPVTPTRLAADLGMRQPTLSNYLKRMTDRGHLRRRRNPHDGRSQLVSLTASGRRVTERSFPGFKAAITAFRDHLELSDDELARVLGSLSDTLDRAVAELEQAAARGETGT